MTKRNSAQRAWMADQIGETTMQYIEQLERENAELKAAAAKTIETRQGEDACGFVEDESVVAKPFAQPLGLSGIARCADE